MKHLNACLYFAALTLVISGCGSKGGSSNDTAPVGALTTEQRARFDQTADGVAEATQWQQVEKNQQGGRPAYSAIASKSTGTSSGKAAVDKLVNPNACIIDVFNDQPTQQQDPTKPGGSMNSYSKSGATIEGASCPISFKWITEQEQTIDPTSGAFAMKVDFKLAYSPNLPVARTGLDVQGYRLDMKIETKQSGQTLAIVGSGSGAISSKARGDIRIEIGVSGAVDAKSQNSTSVMKLVYADGLVVELKEVSVQLATDVQPKVTYTLNGVGISKKEADAYMRKLALDRAEQKSNQQDSGPERM